MLYDLNIAWSPSTSTADLTRTLKFARQLGYNVVAVSHTLGTPIPKELTNPLTPVLKALLPDDGHGDDGSSPLPTVLTRATVALADPVVGHRLPQIAAQYDLVAVRPVGEKMFQNACLAVAPEHAHLISLDLTRQLDFHFRPAQCMAAVRRGMRFEVCYGQVLGGGAGADARARAVFIGNLMQLARATRGRGLVVSSEARAATALRGPADVANLLAVWGLPADRARDALGVTPRGVVVNEGINRRGFRGVVDIVRPAARAEEGGDKKDEGGRMEGVEVEGARKGQQKKEKGGENGAQKRKGAEEPAQGDAPMSKRQAKKLKKLAVVEGKPAEKKA